MRTFLALSALCVAAFLQASAEDTGKEPAKGAAKEGGNVVSGYSVMDYEAGFMESSFDGKIDKMSDGVKITLKSDDPAKQPLPITSREVKFSWPEKGGSQPSKIVLEGKVVVEHPEASVHAEKAEWDFEKGILTFTGSPVMKSPKMPDGIEAQKVVLNFNDGRVQVYGGRAHNARIAGIGEGKDVAKAAKPEEAKKP